MAHFSASDILKKVEESGFHLFDTTEDVPIESLASKLGSPVPSAPGRPITDILVPQVHDTAPPGTLSSLHGVGPFPFHTETAHWKRPVDLVVLRCLHPGSADRRTLLVDGWELGLARDEVRALTQSLSVVKNGSRSFLAAPVEKQTRGLQFRYDKACMKPAYKGATTVFNQLDRLISEAEFQEVHWIAGRNLIFDNRRVLHSRASAEVVDSDRRIERIYIVR